MIVKDSNKEKFFVNELIKAIRELNTNSLSDVNSLESTIITFAYSIKDIWGKKSKVINIIKYSKSWWNANCSRDLKKYKATKHIEN